MTESKEREQIPLLLNKMKQELLTKQEYKYLQYLLLKHEVLYRSNDYCYPYPLCETTITGDKIMFISDTHFGSAELENRNLVWIAYNKALQQNIKTVVHAGDLIEACAFYHNKRYEVVLQELETALYYMPNDLTTKLLLGNHDYSAIRTYSDIIPYFFGTSKLDILGMQKVLLNWDGQADIRINHSISQLKYPETKESEEIITIEGHHHGYSFMEQGRLLYLPSLSNHSLSAIPLSLYQRGLHCYPLFLIASKQGEKNLLFEIFCVKRGEIFTTLCSDKIDVNTETKKLKLYK